MYQTRHRTSLHQDENAKPGADAKPASRVANGKAVATTNNGRQALGDIGNIVQAGKGRRNNEAEGASKKALQPPVGRPITRSFGAQLANKKALEDAAATTLQPSKEANIPVGKITRILPKGRKGRTLTSTLTARSESLCVSDKQEELPNIDLEDVGNQLAVVDFVEDIYSFYRKNEAQSCVPHDYMSHQTNINHRMRAILVDWLIEVHLKFKLMPETLFLTTNIIDRYLAIQSVERKQLQLVGMTALLVASKYEEIWAPEVNDFVYISDNAYTRQQILDMEKTMLNILRFNLCVPTPYVFVVRFLKAAKSDQKLEMLSFYYTELCLVSYEMVKFRPSLLAASAVYTAQNTLNPAGRDCNWSKLLKHHSGYSESELLECSKKMLGLQKESEDGKIQSVVRKKYSMEKYGSVALLKPPSFSFQQTNQNRT